MAVIYSSKEMTKLNFLKFFWEWLWLYFQQNKKHAALELENAELEPCSPAPSPSHPRPSSPQPLFIHKETGLWRVMPHSQSHGVGTATPVSSLTTSCVFSPTVFAWYFSFLMWMNFRVMNLSDPEHKKGMNHLYNRSGSRGKMRGSNLV